MAEATGGERTLTRGARVRSELASAKVLLRQVGPWTLARVGMSVQVGLARGEPWRDLPPPLDLCEQQSREQIGGAVLLYRALCRQLGDPQRALEITGLAVDGGAVTFLRLTIGSLKRARLETLDDAQRTSFAHELGRRFFNATVRWDRIARSEVRFTVTACHFARLMEAVGEPQLAPLFCRGDAHFFGTVEPDVELERHTTLAEGGESCPFVLRWSDASAQPSGTRREGP